MKSMYTGARSMLIRLAISARSTRRTSVLVALSSSVSSPVLRVCVVCAVPPTRRVPVGAAVTVRPSGTKPRFTRRTGPFAIWNGVSTLTPLTPFCVRLIWRSSPWVRYDPDAATRYHSMSAALVCVTSNSARSWGAAAWRACTSATNASRAMCLSHCQRASASIPTTDMRMTTCNSSHLGRSKNLYMSP